MITLTDPLIRRLIEEMLGVHLEQKEIVHFDYWRCGITREQERLVFNRFHKTECEKALPMKDAVHALQSLLFRFEVHIVTARPPESEKLTRKWLKTHNVPYDKLDFLKSKDGSQTRFDAFVEDHRETAYAMARRGIYSFLLDYPWNQPMPVDPTKVIRVSSWTEIRSYLEKVFDEALSAFHEV